MFESPDTIPNGLLFLYRNDIEHWYQFAGGNYAKVLSWMAGEPPEQPGFL